MSLLSQTHAELRAVRLRELVINVNRQLQAAHRRGMALLWEQEADTGPADVLGILGESSAELFQLSAQLVAFIQAIDPDFSPEHIPFAFTIEEDGTVTLGEPILDPDTEVPVE